MESLNDRVAEASRTLVNAGIPASHAAFDAEVLARHALGWDRAAFLSRRGDRASPDFVQRYGAMVARRAAREPVALIIGHREFWGRDFEVTADVLIPRPESEFVIETVLECVGASPAGDDGASARPLTVSKIIDVGTGSGCLAVTLAALFPSTSVVATDTSAAALDVARRNAARHGVAERIQFVQADLLAGLELTADLIVSNPPYVPSAAERTLQPEVALFEPSLALFGGADGLDIVRRLLETAPARLAPGGRLVLEFGDGQEEEIRGLAGARGWHILGIRNDLQDIARVALLGR